MAGDEKKGHERGQDSFPEPLYGAPGMDVALAGNLAHITEQFTSVEKIYETRRYRLTTLAWTCCHKFPLGAAVRLKNKRFPRRESNPGLLGDARYPNR
jgi:hypothetical protein